MQNLDAQSETPLYQQLYLILREQIESENLKPGQKLTSERTLAARHGISRATVRQATQLLAQEGYLHVEQGSGLFVKRPITKEKLRMARLAEGIKPQGLVPVPKVLKAGIVGANPAIANYLQIEKEEKVNLLQRLWLIDDMPMGVETAYVPYKRFRNLLDNDFTQIPLYEALEEAMSSKIDYVDKIISRAPVTQEMYKLLDVTPPTPLSIVECFTYDAEGNIVEYMHGLYRVNNVS